MSAAFSSLGDLDFAMLDWAIEADEVVAAHYSRAVLVVREEFCEEFCVEYDVDLTTKTIAGKRVPTVTDADTGAQELPRVCTLALAEMTCRVHGVGADLLDVTTLRLAHRLDSRGLLIPIAESEVVP